jgi:hypothetical protein
LNPACISARLFVDWALGLFPEVLVDWALGLFPEVLVDWALGLFPEVLGVDELNEKPVIGAVPRAVPNRRSG